MHYDIYPVEVRARIVRQEAQRVAAHERLVRSVIAAKDPKGPLVCAFARLRDALGDALNPKPSTARTPRLTR